MNEVNGKKVWFERHEDDDWFDEVTLQIRERWKTSGLSGDEWRFSYVVQFKRKGVVLHEKSWTKFQWAMLGMGGALLQASDRPMGIEWKQKTGEKSTEWCAQPGCKAKWTVLYRRLKTFENGHDVTAHRSEVLGVPVIGFCQQHRTRGDCGLNDADRNYELMMERS